MLPKMVSIIYNQCYNMSVINKCYSAKGSDNICIIQNLKN